MPYISFENRATNKKIKWLELIYNKYMRMLWLRIKSLVIEIMVERIWRAYIIISIYNLDMFDITFISYRVFKHSTQFSIVSGL